MQKLRIIEEQFLLALSSVGFLVQNNAEADAGRAGRAVGGGTPQSAQCCVGDCDGVAKLPLVGGQRGQGLTCHDPGP